MASFKLSLPSSLSSLRASNSGQSSTPTSSVAWSLAFGAAGAVIGAVAITALIKRRQQRAGLEEDEDDDEEEEVEVMVIGDEDEKAKREIAKKLKLQEKAAKAKAEGKSEDPTKASSNWKPGEVPPKNFKTTFWQQTDLGKPIRDKTYSLEESEYRLKIVWNDGADSKVFKLKELEDLGLMRYDKIDWHCVTGWSYLGLTLYGIPIAKLLECVGNDKKWKWLYQISADGYTCPVAREDIDKNCFFAIREESGALLSFIHGGPRFAFPNLWGWKSSKYLMEIQLLRDYRAGFWETFGCHYRGRVYDAIGIYLEERWADEAKRSGFHDVATWLVNCYHHIFGAKAYGWVMYLGGKMVGILGTPLLRP